MAYAQCSSVQASSNPFAHQLQTDDLLRHRIHLHLESCQLNPLHDGVFSLWRFASFSLPAGGASPFWVKLRALGDIHLLRQYQAL